MEQSPSKNNSKSLRDLYPGQSEAWYLEAEENRGSGVAALSEKHVKKFQDIYRACYGKEIEYKEAYEQAVKLVRFVQLVYGPETQEKVRQFRERSWETSLGNSGKGAILIEKSND